MKRLAIALITLVAATPLLADTLAITGARVHAMTGSGPMDDATIVITDGVITAVGTDVAVPGGAAVIDGTGMEVTPGLIAAYTTIGLTEVSAVDETNDMEVEDFDLGAAYSIARAVNPESVLFGVARAGGVTHALSGPMTGNSLFAGRASLLRLDGGMDPVMVEDLALMVAVGERGSYYAGGSRAAALQMLELGFEEARLFAADDDTDGLRLSRIDLLALGEVLESGGRVAVRADRSSDIRHAVEILQELGLKPVIVGGAEAWRVADFLADAGVPVITDPLANQPESYDGLGSRLDNAALLEAAGVQVAFTEIGGHEVREIRQYAGNAVANGMSWDAALAAITSAPADIWGLEDHGRIEVGAAGDLVIWTGDPLELTTWADTVIMDGVVVPHDSRQLRLQERYRDPQSIYRALD